MRDKDWDIMGTGGDNIDNLSPSFCLWPGLGLKLRFVNKTPDPDLVSTKGPVPWICSTVCHKNSSQNKKEKESTNANVGMLTVYFNQLKIKQNLFF